MPGARQRPAALALMALASVAGCAGSGGDARPLAEAGELAITRAVAPAPIGDAPGALYFTIVNRGATADTLTAIGSDAAGRAMLHDQLQRGGTMVMTHVSELVVPPHDSVRLAPGGLHVMLEELRGTIVAGDTLGVTLHFRRAGAVEIRVPVVTYGELEGRT